MASGNSPEKLGRSGVAGGHCTVVRTESLRAQSARHRVDQPTIGGRSCANSAHYKPLFACVDRTFVKSISSRRRPEKKSASPARVFDWLRTNCKLANGRRLFY